MAESTLSLAWDDFQNEVGRFLGYGVTQGSWSSAQEATVQSCVHSGVRNVMFPPMIPGGMNGYAWSWMHPTTTIDTTASQGEDDLPDDFHQLIGDFHHASNTGYTRVKRVSEGEILERRALDDYNGFPKLCAIRYKSRTGADGQRQEVLWYPEPDDAYTLSYSYDVYPGQLSDTYKYPPGGSSLSELYLESCLAVAEQRVLDMEGIHSKNFMAMLIAAIERDKRRAPTNYGRMGHYEGTSREQTLFRGQRTGSYYLTYDGTPL